MITLAVLHPEVVKFLISVGNMHEYKDGAHGFCVEGGTYTSTNIPGTYTLQYVDVDISENN